MTNEKDREEAYRLAAKIGALAPLSCSDPGCLACFEHRKDAVDLLLNYRAEAVKAERDRCAECADAELKREGFREGKGSTRALVYGAILSDDQEAR